MIQGHYNQIKLRSIHYMYSVNRHSQHPLTTQWSSASSDWKSNHSSVQSSGSMMGLGNNVQRCNFHIFRDAELKQKKMGNALMRQG